MAIELKIDLNLSNAQIVLMRTEQKTEKWGLNMVASVASEGRKIAYSHFFNRSYSRANPNGLNLLQGNTIERGKQGRVDRKGRRLVNFSLENRSKRIKRAYFSSYPMNLFENDAKFPTYTRPGAKIILSKLPPLIYSAVPAVITRMESLVYDEMRKLEDGINS